MLICRRKEWRRCSLAGKASAVLIIIGTGCTEVDYRTVYGSAVVAYGIENSQEEIEFSCLAVAEELVAEFGYRERRFLKRLDGVTIYISPEQYPCSYISEQLCAGSTDGDSYIRYANHECIARTALIHELVHMMVQQALGHIDPRHEDDRLWAVGGVGSRAAKRSHVRFCGTI